MKKYIILGLMLFIISAIIGYFYGGKIFNNQANELAQNSLETETLESQINFNNEIIETNSKEIKVLPSTKLGMKKKFKDCNHISFEFVELPNDFINLTKKEITKKYPEWEIVEFEENKIILFKEVDGICDEHFLIKLGEEFIEIYKIIDKNENTIFYKKTDISIKYLTEDDKEKLKDGIKIYGKDQLNSFLEDYE